MIELYENIFTALNKNIIYAVWKAGHDLHSAVQGKGDIDILIGLEHKAKFKKILQSYRFIQAEFDLVKFPFIEHWYGFDEKSGSICHLHVYFKIVTGESHLKSYHIPIEETVLSRRFLNEFDLYELAYKDQALIYAMRHYMKISSLFGFFLWAYEKKDYYGEFSYIKKGLHALDIRDSDQDHNELTKEFEFDQLDMSVGFSGYKKALEKKKHLKKFRLYDSRTALWKSIYYFGIRVYFKVFGIRKNLDKGVVLAISGVDGSGKSSMVYELQDWFGKNFNAYALHLGRPSPTALTFLLRPFLLAYRGLKKQRLDNDSSDYKEPSGLKKKNGFVWAFRYLVLAYERLGLARKAQKFSSIGSIVICDRYPTNSPGKMDSPGIQKDGSWLVEMMRRCELQLYKSIPKADVLIFLNVSRNEAIQRNRARIKKDKETDMEISVRHKENQELNFNAKQVIIEDAGCSYSIVLNNLKRKAWSTLMAPDRLKEQRLSERAAKK